MRSIGIEPIVSETAVLQTACPPWATTLNGKLMKEAIASQAPVHGFEPRYTASEAVVLPLDDTGLEPQASFHYIEAC